MSDSLRQYLESHRQRILDELFAFLRIPSVSTLPEHRTDVYKAAGFVAESLQAAGMDRVEVIETEGHPLVYGEWLRAPDKPTVLCYGHYDVQPPDPLEEWTSPPFEPVIRNGKIYARGASDDKGQMYMHIKAVEALRAIHGSLPVNVKFLIEGEEEIGGASIRRYLHDHREQLRADAALVSDTELFAPGIPTLCTGLRGLLYAEIEAEGASHDLHSGTYGGAAPNALFGLVQLLAEAKSPDGVIQLPGVYDDVEVPSEEERESWRQLPFDEEVFRQEIGAPALVGEEGFHVLERLWARPTFEVHGIAGGFTGPGSKTVIPARATAKVSLRLVPRQDPEKVRQALERFVAERTPKGIRTQVRVTAASPAVLIDRRHPAIQIAAQVLGELFGRPTVFTRAGGSVPIVGQITQELGIPVVMMGFGLPDDCLHAPNEKFNVENLFLGIEAVARFLERYGAGR